MKRRVLGKGLEAIISNQPQDEQESNYREIDVSDIYPNPFQPRKEFSEDLIRELADSLKEVGLIQPISVYRQDNRFFLIVGERRWRAAQLLHWKKIPAIVRELSIDDVMIGAMVENIQREDLNPVEVAQGIEMMMEKNGFTHEQVSVKLGMNRTTVTNLLRLLKLPEGVKIGLIAGKLSQGHARALLGLKDSADIEVAYEQVLKKDLSVRQTEKWVKTFYEKKEKQEDRVDPDLRRTEEKLARFFSTKVKLNYSKQGSGRIEIYFNHLDEFERLYQMFVSKENKE